MPITQSMWDELDALNRWLKQTIIHLKPNEDSGGWWIMKNGAQSVRIANESEFWLYTAACRMMIWDRELKPEFNVSLKKNIN